MEEKVRQIVEKILDMPIDPETAGFGITPTWDELRHLEIMISLEDELGIMFDQEESRSLLTFRKIIGKLESDMK